MVARLLIPYRLLKLALLWRTKRPRTPPKRKADWIELKVMRRPGRRSCCSTVGVARRQPNSSDCGGFINGQKIIVHGGFEHMLMSLLPRPDFERGN